MPSAETAIFAIFLANVAPKQTHDMCQACLDGDFKSAETLFVKYAGLFSTLFVETNPIPVKAAMEMMGLCRGEMRLPLISISDVNRLKLKQQLQLCGINV